MKFFEAAKELFAYYNQIKGSSFMDLINGE